MDVNTSYHWTGHDIFALEQLLKAFREDHKHDYWAAALDASVDARDLSELGWRKPQDFVANAVINWTGLEKAGLITIRGNTPGMIEFRATDKAEAVIKRAKAVEQDRITGHQALIKAALLNYLNLAMSDPSLEGNDRGKLTDNLTRLLRFLPVDHMPKSNFACDWGDDESVALWILQGMQYRREPRDQAMEIMDRDYEIRRLNRDIADCHEELGWQGVPRGNIGGNYTLIGRLHWLFEHVYGLDDLIATAAKRGYTD